MTRTKKKHPMGTPVQFVTHALLFNNQNRCVATVRLWTMTPPQTIAVDGFVYADSTEPPVCGELRYDIVPVDGTRLEPNRKDIELH